MSLLSRIVLICCGLLAAAPLFAQTTVLDGVYSRQQAQRGARTYRNICSHCHEGGEPDADPLFGPDFIDRWREAPLSFLHGFISTRMPGDEAGSLSAQVYLETVAYLLQENGYPDGQELAAETLQDILLTGPEGPQPMPLNALVRVSGCLQQTNDRISLAQGSILQRVRTADETTPGELAASAVLEGDAAVQHVLDNTGNFSLDTLLGRKVQAKGVLTSHNANGITMTVLSLDDTGARCAD
jgi:mono/diheme cytochrome c family protein